VSLKQTGVKETSMKQVIGVIFCRQIYSPFSSIQSLCAVVNLSINNGLLAYTLYTPANGRFIPM